MHIVCESNTACKARYLIRWALDNLSASPHGTVLGINAPYLL